MNLSAGKKDIPSTKFIQLFYTLFYILRSELRISTQCKYKCFIDLWQSLIIEVQVLSVQPPL